MTMHTRIALATPPIALLRALPSGPLATEYRRLKRLAKLFSAFDRDDMEAAVALLIAELDVQDGDPDIEANGDELDGDDSEEDFMFHSTTDSGAGCPVAECGTNQFGAGDPSWTEWHTRGAAKLDQFGDELVGRDRCGNLLREDIEDDDPHDESHPGGGQFQ